MAISSIVTGALSSSFTGPLGSGSALGASGGVRSSQLNAKSFEAIRSEVQSGVGLDFPAQLKAVETRALSGKALTPTELLGAQIAVHRFNLKVEVASKGVEAFTSSVRRFQQQQ